MQGVLEQAGDVKQKLIDDGVPVNGRNLFVMINFVMYRVKVSKTCKIFKQVMNSLK
jgi:hypothetical protein